MTAEVVDNRMSKSEMIKWAAAILIPAMILLIPTSATLTTDIKIFLVITSFCLMLVAFEVIDILIPSLILPMMYTLFNLAPANVVFESWSNPLPWMYVGIFIFAGCLERIGLIKRLAYACVAKIGKNFATLTISILVAGIILSIVLTGGNAELPLLIFVFGICKGCGWNNTKESIILMFTVCVATYMAQEYLLNPYIFMMTGMVGYDQMMTFPGFFKQMGIFLPFGFLVLAVAYFMYKPEGKMPPREYFHNEYKALGKMSKDEIKGAILCIICVVMLMTLNIHKIPMGWIFVLLACVLYMPGIRLGTKEDVAYVNFGLTFFIAACMTIGSVANTLGIGKLIADTAMPYLANFGVTGVLTSMMIIGILSNFIMSPLAIFAALTIPFVEITTSMGIDPIVTIQMIQMASHEVVFPYENTGYLIMFTFGMMGMKDFIKIFGLKAILSVIYFACVAIPYWKIIGLL